jgi:cobalt/nickel transport protein
MKKTYSYIFALLVIVALVAIPLVVYQNASFAGTDDNAIQAIQSIDREYHPWYQGVKLFQSPEIISTFFALQAALGAGFLGYYIGYSRGKRANEKK